MAKLNQDKITITISEMVRNDEPTETILDAEVLEQLLAVVQELVGEKRLVEVSFESE
jgi:ABC-type histidine transport system ATPase subunit